MNPSHPNELLPDYVLGLLTPEETVMVERHLEGCDACQEEAWRLAQPLVLLTEALPIERPPERVRLALKARFLERAPTRVAPAAASPPPSYHYAWSLAAFSLVLALGSFLWGLRGYEAYQRAQADERLLSTFLARPQAKKVVLENILESDRARSAGSALLAPGGGVLFVLTEAASPGRTYQAWGHTSSDWDPERGEALESLRTSQSNIFEVEAAGFASLYLSLEPVGGSPQPTDPPSKISLLNPVPDAPIEILTPAAGATVTTGSVIVTGVVVASSTSLSYTLNGSPATETAFANNRFSFTVPELQEGENTLVVTATSVDGETATASVKVTYTP